MIADPNIAALQMALLEVMIKASGDKKQVILDRAEFYRHTFLAQGGMVVPTIHAALSHMKTEIENTTCTKQKSDVE